MKIITSILFAAFFSSLHIFASGDVVSFTYDAAGNRIRRHVMEEQQQNAPRRTASHIRADDFIIESSVTRENVVIHTSVNPSVYEMNWQLCDVQGRLVSSGKITSSATTISINRSSGFFLLTITKNGEAKTFKLIKL